MSEQAIVNWKELLDFAHTLKRYNANLDSEASQLKARYRRLGETWRDQKYAKFSQEFEAMTHLIDRFLRTSEDVIPKLEKEATLVRDRYLGRG